MKKQPLESFVGSLENVYLSRPHFLHFFHKWLQQNFWLSINNFFLTLSYFQVCIAIMVLACSNKILKNKKKPTPDEKTSIM